MTSLAAYVIRRLILLVFVIFGVTVLIFGISMLFPPDVRALLYIRNVQMYKPDVIRSIIEKYGLNDPFYLQYGRWMGQVLQGNLGWAHSSSQTVVDAIATRWPNTFELVMFIAPLIVFIGIYLGVQSAIHRNGVIDHVTRVFSIIGWSLPSFWLGLLLLAIFYGMLGWLPPGSLSHEAQLFVSSPSFIRYTRVDIFDGILNGQLWITIDALRHVILPVIVIVTIDVALLIRVMRSSMLEALSKPYVVTARAKGLKEKAVIYKHVRRNALIPVATLSGMLVASLLGGLIITETVFGFGGLGQWTANAAIQIDMPSVLGYAILSAFIFVIANLIVDILYAYIDPRIRLE
jgi:peptide/nickel transport system permease protein